MNERIVKFNTEKVFFKNSKILKIIIFKKIITENFERCKKIRKKIKHFYKFQSRKKIKFNG